MRAWKGKILGKTRGGRGPGRLGWAGPGRLGGRGPAGWGSRTTRAGSALHLPNEAAPRAGRAGQRPLSAEAGSSPHRPMPAGSGPEQPRVGGPVRGGALAAGRVAAAVRLSGRRVGAKDY